MVIMDINRVIMIIAEGLVHKLLEVLRLQDIIMHNQQEPSVGSAMEEMEVYLVVLAPDLEAEVDGMELQDLVAPVAAHFLVAVDLPLFLDIPTATE